MVSQRSAPPDDPTVRARVAALARTAAARALAAAAGGQHRVLLVGGALRDAALGVPVGDLDAIALEGGGELADRLARAIGGRVVRLAPGRFAAWRVVGPDFEIDLWDLEGGELAADLARRDLCINAIALDLGSGEILDPHGGLADLARGRLRAVRRETFAEDPLRVLRLARFAVALAGFEIEAPTAAAARAAAAGLDRVAGERIRDELAAIAALGRPAAGQRALVAVGAFPGLWCGFSGLVAPTEDGVAAFERMARASRRVAGPPPLDEQVAAEHALRLALSHPPGRAGRGLDRLVRRAAVTTPQARAIRALLAESADSPPGGDALALWLWRLGGRWASGLALAVALAPAADEPEWSAVLDRARRLVAERGDGLLAARPLLSGGEASALLGIAPGPALGAALKDLVEAQVLGRVVSVEAARAFLVRRARADGG